METSANDDKFSFLSLYLFTYILMSLYIYTLILRIMFALQEAYFFLHKFVLFEDVRAYVYKYIYATFVKCDWVHTIKGEEHIELQYNI